MELAVPLSAFEGFEDDMERQTAICVLSDYAISQNWYVRMIGKYLYFCKHNDSSETKTLTTTNRGHDSGEDSSNLKSYMQTINDEDKACNLSINNRIAVIHLMIKYLKQDKQKTSGKLALTSILEEPILAYRKMIQLDKSKTKEAAFIANHILRIYIDGHKHLLSTGDINTNYILKHAIDYAYYELLQWYLKFNPQADPRSTSNSQVIDYFTAIKCAYLHTHWLQLYMCRHVNARLSMVYGKTDQIQDKLLESMANQSDGLIQVKLQVKDQIKTCTRRLKQKLDMEKTNVGLQYKKHILEDKYYSLLDRKEKLMQMIAEKKEGKIK
jgi:hypothetical protein